MSKEQDEINKAIKRFTTVTGQDSDGNDDRWEIRSFAEAREAIQRLIVDSNTALLDRVYKVYMTPSKESGYLSMEHIIEQAKLDIQDSLNNKQELK